MVNEGKAGQPPEEKRFCVVVDAVVFRKKVLTGLFSPILLTGYVFYGGYVRLCQVALHDVLIADLSQA